MPSSLGRVLVVDDDDVIRQLITVNLELEGFEVATAVDGQDCLDKVKDVRPDVITLDIMMPRLDGWEAAGRLRADPDTAGIKVVLLSARAQEADLPRRPHRRGRLPDQAVRPRRAHRDGTPAGGPAPGLSSLEGVGAAPGGRRCRCGTGAGREAATVVAGAATQRTGRRLALHAGAVLRGLRTVGVSVEEVLDPSSGPKRCRRRSAVPTPCRLSGALQAGVGGSAAGRGCPRPWPF